MRQVMNGRWKPEDRTPLALLRFNAGFSREQAAVMMQISNSTLANYERGIKDISFLTGEKMADLYNVSFEEIHQAAVETRKISPVQSEKKLNDRDIINKAINEADNIKKGVSI
jgi:transcriptional regulator with XRE-family HTH domain